MNRLRALIISVLSLLAVTVILACTVPISWLADHAPASVQLAGVQGSVFSGHAEEVRFQHTRLGRVTWHFAPARLLHGELCYDLSITAPGHHLQGRFGIAPRHTWVAYQVDMEWPLRSLSDQVVWGGMLTASIDSLHLRNSWPTLFVGSLTVRHFTRPDSNVDLGSYTLDLSAGPTPHEVLGHLRDVAGPLAVDATLSLAADRSYHMDGSVLPRAGTPEDVKDSFTFLGPPDASGRRLFQMAGSM